MLVLGIESSCDETAAAVVADGRRVKSSVVAGQMEIHALYGGIVPELAARAHTERITRVIELALSEAGIGLAEIDGLAVTTSPGLIGPLLIGSAAAKALALAAERPLVGVHHLAAHAWAARLATEHPLPEAGGGRAPRPSQPEADAGEGARAPSPLPEAGGGRAPRPSQPEVDAGEGARAPSPLPKEEGEKTAPAADPPLLALVASGGHTSLFSIATEDDFLAPRLVGSTLDDAAGEAFDKVAKILGLGYPGGPLISRAAEDGNISAYDFPRTFLNDGPALDFSFSGIKTAVRYLVEGVPGGKKRRRRGREKAPRHEVEPPKPESIPDIAASFQEAVVDVLVAKTFRAAEELDVERVVVAGGVACNKHLRERMKEEAARQRVELFIPPPEFSADNAAMVAGLGWLRLSRGEDDGLSGETVGGLERRRKEV